MTEVFNFASDVLSVAEFANQLAQNAIFLHNFINEIRNASNNVQALDKKFRILEFILANIQKSFTRQNADFEHALKYREKRLNELLKFVKRLILINMRRRDEDYEIRLK